jgi:hypothetical protein
MLGPSEVDRGAEISALQHEIGELSRRLEEVHALVHRTHLELFRRISSVDNVPPGPIAQESIAKMRADEYLRLVHRVQAAVYSSIPDGAVVAVVTRGDEAFLELDGRFGWHFPRLDDGRYAGHYPADDDDAIAQVEQIRKAGANYLVLPTSAQWWLDYYQGLRRHLEANARLVVRQEDACSIFALAPAPSGVTARTGSLVT